MSLTVTGIGTAVPEAKISQQDALVAVRRMSGSVLDGASYLPAIYRYSGVQTRYQVLGQPFIDDILGNTRHTNSPFLPGLTPPSTSERMAAYAKFAAPLAIKATRQALQQSGEKPATITHLVTVSCTGFDAPGVDIALIDELGLRPQVERVHIGYMGCHGAINGIRVANALSLLSPRARVILSAVELCSLHYYYGADADKVVANALFADGAATLIGRPAYDGERWQVKATGSCLMPNTREAMAWRIGDAGFEMTLSKEIPSLIEQHLRPWLIEWLAGQNLTIETVGSWAVHPGGARILSAVENGLQLPSEALAISRQVFGRYGNMSSPTVMFIVDELKRQNMPGPCLMLGFGPGMVAEVALLN